MSHRLFTFSAILLILLYFSGSTSSAPMDEEKRKTRQAEYSPISRMGTPRYQILNINNIWTWHRSDGQSNHSPTSNDGAFFPRSTKMVIYQDAFMWGGKAFLDSDYTQPHPTEVLRVGGATYNVGTGEGRVIGFGTTAVPANPADPDVRIYRIRRDYAAMSIAELTRDAAEYYEILEANVTEPQRQQIRDWYNLDWTQWPASYGAPCIERNGVPGYQQPPPFSSSFTVDSLIAGNYDEPGIAGVNSSLPADQVVWTVLNDLNRARTIGLYGTEPLGLEAQVTLWGYKRTDAVGQGYFKRIRLINKGGVTGSIGSPNGYFYIDSMFIAQWTDPDVGDFTDDLSGCDTVRSIGYTYNGQAVDNQFNQVGLPPPSIGYALLQGPIVPGLPGHTATFNMRQRPGYRNLTLSSFAYFAAGSPISDPPYTSEGAKRWWKMFRGLVPDPSTSPDRRYPHPPGTPESVFPLSGDPVSQTGFLDGLGTTFSFAMGDRRHVMNTGPFRLAPGDTQEVVYATVGGLGSTFRTSVGAMRTNVDSVKKFWTGLTTSVERYSGGSKVPGEFRLEQNYPNPFNPVTNFQFTIPGSQLTTLKVFNLLGEEVATPVNEVLLPGTYRATFDGSGLASGIYFYRLQSGPQIQTQKMILLK